MSVGLPCEGDDVRPERTNRLSRTLVTDAGEARLVIRASSYSSRATPTSMRPGMTCTHEPRICDAVLAELARSRALIAGLVPASRESRAARIARS